MRDLVRAVFLRFRALAFGNEAVDLLRHIVKGIGRLEFKYQGGFLAVQRHVALHCHGDAQDIPGEDMLACHKTVEARAERQHPRGGGHDNGKHRAVFNAFLTLAPNILLQLINIDLFFKKDLAVHTGTHHVRNQYEKRIDLAELVSVVPVAPSSFPILHLVPPFPFCVHYTASYGKVASKRPSNS